MLCIALYCIVSCYDVILMFTHPGLAPFTSQPMQDTCFNDLSIRLGSYYLYQHQGDCKHTIIFTELRMLHSTDMNLKLAYPMPVFKSRTKQLRCFVCCTYPAVLVTYDDKLANHNPCYFCLDCYQPLHYSKDGHLLYNDFKVFPYTGK